MRRMDLGDIRNIVVFQGHEIIAEKSMSLLLTPVLKDAKSHILKSNNEVQSGGNIISSILKLADFGIIKHIFHKTFSNWFLFCPFLNKFEEFCFVVNFRVLTRDDVLVHND